MKKITKPSEDEEAVYYSDFTGKILSSDLTHKSPVKLKLDFNYGSKYDGDTIILHLDDNDAEEILNFLKSKINLECKEKYEQFK